MLRALHPASDPTHRSPTSPSVPTGKASMSPASAISPSAQSFSAKPSLDASPQKSQTHSLRHDRAAKVAPPPAELILQAISPTRHDSSDSVPRPDPAPRPSSRSSRSPSSVRQHHQFSGLPHRESAIAGRSGLLGVGHAAGSPGSDADDDMCRMSSVRDTPASSVATTKASKATRCVPAESKSASRHSQGARDVPAGPLAAQKGSWQPGQSSRPSPPAARDISGGTGKQSKVARSAGQGTAAGRDPAHDGIPRAGATSSPPLPKPR